MSRYFKGRSLSQRSLIRAFLRMLLIFIPIIIIMTVSIFLYAQQTIQMEFTSINLSSAQQIGDSLNELVTQMRYITASLLTEESSQFFFAQESPSAQNMKEINGQIRSFRNTMTYLDSIYVYAPQVGYALDGHQVHQALHSLNDQGWLAYVEEEGPMQLIPRSKENGYPYVLSAMKRMTLRGFDGVAVVNISLQDLTNVLRIQEDQNHLFYLLTGDGQVLYRHNKQALTEPSEQFEDLEGFTLDRLLDTRLGKDKTGRAFVWSQVYIPELDFYVVYKTYLQEYTQRVNALQGLIFSVAAVLLLAFLSIAAYLAYEGLRPLHHLEKVLDQADDVQPDKQSEYIRYLTQRIMLNIHNNAALKEELTDQLILMEKNQMRSLRAQINPHFLFNTLNSIGLQISGDEEDRAQAIRMTSWLSDLLRYSLAIEDAVSLQTELNQARTFLQILMARYESFQVEYDVAPGLENVTVPRVFLQPLIENAVFHGITPLQERNGILKLCIAKEENDLRIALEDNGIGIPPEKLEQLRNSLEHLPQEMPAGHIGLLNVAMRLNLMYPDAPPIQVDSIAGEMTLFTIRIPLAASVQTE